MRYAWLLGCAVLSLAPAWGEDKSSADRGATLPQREWIVVGIEGEGYKATLDELEGMKWSIEGTTITATEPGGSGRMRYRLNPQKTPKEIDLTSLDGPLKGHWDPGIYEIEKGQLRICYRDPDNTGGERPTAFAAAAPENSGYGIIILEKKRK